MLDRKFYVHSYCYSLKGLFFKIAISSFSSLDCEVSGLLLPADACNQMPFGNNQRFFSYAIPKNKFQLTMIYFG